MNTESREIIFLVKRYVGAWWAYNLHCYFKIRPMLQSQTFHLFNKLWTLLIWYKFSQLYSLSSSTICPSFSLLCFFSFIYFCGVYHMPDHVMYKPFACIKSFTLWTTLWPCRHWLRIHPTDERTTEGIQAWLTRLCGPGHLYVSLMSR